MYGARPCRHRRTHSSDQCWGQSHGIPLRRRTSVRLRHVPSMFSFTCLNVNTYPSVVCGGNNDKHKIVYAEKYWGKYILNCLA